ncbi:MAG: cache domain-containing protein [Lachnospiraceae bacterium]|nr:cache domain-containing protein [Lachnospiraceae bacterium]MDD3660739.1 cache domain-containing protein [Lachnospiraceae bacterium]
MKLKYKLVLLFMFMICVLSIVTGTYSIVQMKNKIIEAAQSKLLSDLALSRTLLESRYPGDWSLKDGQLYKGDFPFNYDYTLVDEIGDLTGDTVTIFQKNMRISTNVIQQDGARAIDTPVSDTVSNAVLSNGETYVGKANVVGTWNQTVYEPIRDSSENIIGIW